MNVREPIVEIDEKTLVERARKEDVSAFRQLVERYQKQIYHVSLDFTGNHHDAEDVVQDVLIKAYRSLGTFRGDSRFSTWIHRITINTCLDRARRMSLPTTSTEELPGYVDYFIERSPSMNPERSAEAGLIQKHIDAAVQRLTPLERSVFILRSYNELSIKEVARILDRSEGTIKNMLWRALQKLQRDLSFYRKELGLEVNK